VALAQRFPRRSHGESGPPAKNTVWPSDFGRIKMKAGLAVALIRRRDIAWNAVPLVRPRCQR